VNSKNPYLFLTGCTRSGTTLLQRMLDHHGDLAVSNDTHVIPRVLMSKRPDPEWPLSEDLIEEVTAYKYFSKLGFDKEETRRIASTTNTFVGFVQALFDEFARRQGKMLAGEKDPEYVRRLPFLHRLFPAARMVHIIRDGRDVALSTLDWVTPARFLGRLPLWHEEPVAVCALWWRRQVLAGIQGGEEVGSDRYREVRYEELVREPEAVLPRLAEFLDLTFDPAMLDYHQGRTRLTPGLSSKDQWLPPTGGLRDWRGGLSPRDVQLFEALSSDLLALLGYPVATDSEIPGDVRAVAERCERWWETEVGHQPASAGAR
jgi:hypothetical protein